MSPGSIDIVVDIPAVERAHPTEMPDRQFGDWTVAGDHAGPALSQEPFQQGLHRDTLPLGFLDDPNFCFP
ncbi:MAG: hypothetical protein ABSH49_07185 [Bryobacteraceae bacterium]